MRIVGIHPSDAWCYFKICQSIDLPGSNFFKKIMVDPECILILVDPGPWHNELPVLSRQPARGAAMVAKVPCNLTPPAPP